MDALFQEGRIGTLALPNRLIRSATAERRAEADGRVRPELARMYRALVRGGVGLIVTGHAFVHPSGQAHPEMTGLHSDAMIPGLRQLTGVVHAEGGRVAAQINHGGMQCDPATVAEPFAPSGVKESFLPRPVRGMAAREVEEMAIAYGEAARRAKDAGFDAVQIHAAHGYLVSQFLSPYVNRRADEWGGSTEKRMRFLRRICAEVRIRVGAEYPVFVKLGVIDGVEGGLAVEEAMRIVAALEGMGLDAVEISGGVGGGRNLNTRPGIKDEGHEAYFRAHARRAREATRLPIILVGGLRTKRLMEEVIESGDADFVSLARPLICEPDLPRRMRDEGQLRASCLSGNNCWPAELAEGITCKCPVGEEIAESSAPSDVTAP
ncbi:MAG: NADH:flavin oxidoreductase [Planctomycetota bacterium]